MVVDVGVCCGAEEVLERGEGKVKFKGGHFWWVLLFWFGPVGFVEDSCRLSRRLGPGASFRVYPHVIVRYFKIYPRRLITLTTYFTGIWSMHQFSTDKFTTISMNFEKL